jgi:hypothetical protein
MDAPFGTLRRAQEAVRELVEAGLQADVTVRLRAGTYELAEPLIFGPQDAGTAEHAVTYAAYEEESVTVSGGVRITGWREAGPNTWTAQTDGGFRQLFADGGRLTRARFPNAPELLHVTKVSEDVTRITFQEDLPAGDLADAGAELVMYQNWSISRVPVVSSSANAVTLSDPMGWIGHGPYTTASPGKPALLENAPAFVDQAGEWYLDPRTDVVTYHAAPGENPNERVFIAPRTERLVVVNGEEDDPVRNLRFEGLTFAHAAWRLPEFGYRGIQAGHYGTTTGGDTYVLGGALEFVFVQDAALTRCRIAHTGASAVNFGAGCANNRVTACIFEDIGGNGLVFGWRGRSYTDQRSYRQGEGLAADWREEAFIPRDNAVVGSVFRRCGAVNHGCVGVYDAFCRNTRIAHNLVTAMPYTGISLGFRWNESETSQSGTLVEYNHVHDVMRMLADGGCVYTLGWQPGTVLRGNVLHGVHRSAFAHGGAPNNGIFFDQGTKGIHVEDNTIYDATGGAIRFNQTHAGNLTWEDNSFGIGRGYRSEP